MKDRVKKEHKFIEVPTRAYDNDMPKFPSNPRDKKGEYMWMFNCAGKLYKQYKSNIGK